MASRVDPALRAASSILALIFFCSACCLAGSRSFETANGTSIPTSKVAAMYRLRRPTGIGRLLGAGEGRGETTR